MKNKQDFILKVEREGAIGSLNGFIYRCFDRRTAVWSDCAERNILLFVTDGEAVVSGGSGDDSACGTTLVRKVTILRRGEPFVVEFQPGCRVLTYAFDSYLPMDATVCPEIGYSSEHAVGEIVAAEIPAVLYRELVNVSQNIGSIIRNETLTHLAMRKVTSLMRRCLKPALTAKLFMARASELSGEIFRYMKLAENRGNLTKKSTEVIF